MSTRNAWLAAAIFAAVAAPAAGGSPTPNANEPAVVCPSCSDVVRHVTV